MSRSILTLTSKIFSDFKIFSKTIYAIFNSYYLYTLTGPIQYSLAKHIRGIQWNQPEVSIRWLKRDRCISRSSYPLVLWILFLQCCSTSSYLSCVCVCVCLAPISFPVCSLWWCLSVLVLWCWCVYLSTLLVCSCVILFFIFIYYLFFNSLCWDFKSLYGTFYDFLDQIKPPEYVWDIFYYLLWWGFIGMSDLWSYKLKSML